MYVPQSSAYAVQFLLCYDYLQVRRALYHQMSFQGAQHIFVNHEHDPFYSVDGTVLLSLSIYQITLVFDNIFWILIPSQFIRIAAAMAILMARR